MAFADTPGSAGFGAFVPLLLMGLIFGWFFYALAKRKGRNRWLWFLAGFVPVYGWFAGLWLASIPDRSLIERLQNVESKLQDLFLAQQHIKDTSEICPSRTWQCNCGRANEIALPSCPECGLKRDYLLGFKKA